MKSQTSSQVDQSLRDWIATHYLNVEFQANDKILKASIGIFLIVEPKSFYDSIIEKTNSRVIGDNMSLILSDDDINLLNKYGADYFLLKFGTRYYYFDESNLDTKQILDTKGDISGIIYYINNWKEFKYIGKPNLVLDNFKMAYLGIHGSFDLCNGSGSYEDWCEQASWLGIEAVGICESNTLAGSLDFQNVADKFKLKSIIGETITVKPIKGTTYQIKLYCKNEMGWRNLLQVNKIINTGVERNIGELDLFTYTTGLICILTPTINVSKIHTQYIQAYEDLFYQLDFCEWSGERKDKEWLDELSIYLKSYKDIIKPILICDSFYIEKKDNGLQPILWSIGKRERGNDSKDKYFKVVDEIFEQAVVLFSSENEHILYSAMENTLKLAEMVDFKIPTGNKYLPAYELTEDEQKQHGDAESLFWSLIEKGLQEKVIDRGLDAKVYIDRIQEEYRVITLGGVRDYFLIVWDIMNFCKINDITRGNGRGSSAGCLISYLLDIVQIDPIHYGLLFERFLDETRIHSGLPDIDSDIMSSRREEVKRYIEQKYGVNYVASIGTYGTFKIRAAIKDLIREIGGDAKEATYISAILDGEDSFIDLFRKALEPTINKRLKKFIQKHALQLDHIPSIINQPKNASIHAAGVIIVPKAEGSIYQQLPVKHIDGIVVSEWEGEYVDQVGFVKIDILGVKQFDKFAEILHLIKQNRNQTIILNNINLEDNQVYNFFQSGWNEDVFQFGGQGLRTFCKELKPETIEDLIATVALYRPGPIEIGAHLKYAKIKNGEELPEYDFGTEQITKITHGVYCYQEQIMQIVQQIGGFSLTEANTVRKAMGKKLPEVMAKYKQQFIEGAVLKNCPRLTAENIWFKMEGFANYAFNRSHAACYAITGYHSQWLKVKFPLEFWLISLKYTDQKEIQARISEIKAIQSNIDIVGPDVLKSQKQYFGDIDTNTIYWALNSISYVSEAATHELIKLRDVDNRFFANFEDFYNITQTAKVEKKKNLQEGQRMKSPLNKRVITNLIIAGAFDRMENIGIGHLYKRGDLLKQFYQLQFPELKLEPFSFSSEKWKKRMNEDLMVIVNYKRDYQWILLQKSLCGFGDVNFKELLSQVGFASQADRFHSNKDIEGLELAYHNERVVEQTVVIAGVVQSVIERKSKNGPFVQLLIHDGEKELYLTIWNEVYTEYKNQIDGSGNQILFMNGVVNFDKYKNANVIHSKSFSEIKILN